MTADGSVTRWLQPLAEGDEEAARQLFTRYYRRLEGLARARLAGRPGGVADQEDVAQSAFLSFCHGMQQRRLDPPANRHSLWALLATITVRKASRARRGRPPHEPLADDAAAGRDPPPDADALAADTLDHLLAVLEDDLRPFAELTLAGLTAAEVADRLGVCRRTVTNKLHLIRKIWGREVDR